MIETARMQRTHLSVPGLVVLCATLGACAGGGGAPATPSSIAVAPTFTSLEPIAAAPAQNFETAEYHASSLSQIGASQAYAAGASGAGTLVAVIDSGVDAAHPDLIDRIHPGSRDLNASRNTLTDPDGHGHFIAGVIAAARNDVGTQGVAFNAQILAVRADRGDSCAASCLYAARDVAAGIDHAVANAADVINLSLSNGDDGSFEIDAALARAASADVAFVLAAGNAGASEPDAIARFAGTTAAQGLGIIAGAAGPDNEIASFSNRAGDYANVYVLAPGVNVTSTQLTSACDTATCTTSGSGTSYATPYISGALALLIEAFPNISTADAVDILLESATDLGAPGPDPIYGRGLLNLDAAFSPLGATSLAVRPATQAPAGETSPPPSATPLNTQALFASAQGPFGDWIFASNLFDGALIRDRYNRGFTLNAPQPSATAHAAMADFSTAATANRQPVRRQTTAFGAVAWREAEQPLALYDHISADTTPDVEVSFTHRSLTVTATRGLTATGDLSPSGGFAPLSARAQAGVTANIHSETATSLAYTHGAWRAQVRQAAGDVGAVRALGLSYHWRAHVMALETGLAQEDEAIWGGALGARFGDTDQAQSQFTSLAWGGALPGAWRGAARVEWAIAEVSAGPNLAVTQAPAASSWSLSAQRPVGPLVWGLSLSQPLRAESGAVRVDVAVDTTTNGVGTVFETRTAALTPSGREVQLESAWSTTLRADSIRSLSATLAARLAVQPGHMAAAPPSGALWFGLRSQF